MSLGDEVADGLEQKKTLVKPSSRGAAGGLGMCCQSLVLRSSIVSSTLLNF